MNQMEYTIIDADAHAAESNELFDHFLDKAFRHKAPRFVADAGARFVSSTKAASSQRIPRGYER